MYASVISCWRNNDTNFNRSGPSSLTQSVDFDISGFRTHFKVKPDGYIFHGCVSEAGLHGESAASSSQHEKTTVFLFCPCNAGGSYACYSIVG
jgi:hypothetical protein